MPKHHHLYLFVVAIYGIVILRTAVVIAFQLQIPSSVYQNHQHHNSLLHSRERASSIHHRLCSYCQRYDSSVTQLQSSKSKEDTYIYTQLDSDDNKDSIDTINCNRDLEHVLHTIERAAHSAGEIALSTAGKIAVKDTKANTRDLVTESDVACQTLIKDIILKDFPNDMFLGEEGIDLSGDSSTASADALSNALGIHIEDDKEEDRLLFVVDPIGKLLCYKYLFRCE